MIDPSGTRDPFWYNIEKFYGASDHQVHLDWDPRIPAVQFGNWPDAVYHSSDDSPANQDPTQMKRAAFLMIAVGSVFANAGRRRRRGGRRGRAVVRPAAHRRGSRDALAADLVEHRGRRSTTNYKEALNLVRQAYVRERADVQSAATLAAGDKAAIADIARWSRRWRHRSRSTPRA